MLHTKFHIVLTNIVQTSPDYWVWWSEDLFILTNFTFFFVPEYGTWNLYWKVEISYDT